MTSRWPLELDIDPGRSQVAHEAQSAMDPAVWAAGVPLALLAPPARSGAEIDGLFLPEGYEPTYAYPLLVWLSTVPVSPCEFERRMRAISERNYLGVCIPVSPQAEVADVALQVQNVVCAVRRDYHLHSERIILAAAADAAALSLEVALRHPAWFGGVVSLGAPPTARCLLAEAGLSGVPGGNPGERLACSQADRTDPLDSRFECPALAMVRRQPDPRECLA
jgi:hypothetical protein